MKVEELVEEIKTNCDKLEDVLYKKLDEFTKRGLCDLKGEKDADVHGIEYRNDIIKLIREEQTIYDHVTVPKRITKVNAENEAQHLDTLIKLANATLYDIEEYVKSKEEVLAEEEKEVVHKAKTHKPRRGLMFLLGGLTGAALLAAALFGVCQIKSCNTQRSNSGIEQSTDEDEEKTTEVPNTKDNPTESTEKTTEAEKTTEPTKETEPQLKLGEYGTFTDINDNEQVEARAQYLYDYAVNKMWESIDESDRGVITVENIANLIRENYDLLPLDDNGYEYFSGNSLNDMTTVFSALVINGGSRDGHPYMHFPAHLLFVDGSEESEFVKSYDVLYDKLVYAMNVNDDVQAQDAIACLGYKYWKEWYEQGAHTNVNPHSFKTDVKFFTICATLSPFNQTGLEWEQSKKTPVCIEVCTDYNTQKTSVLEVNEIETAIETGVWNDIKSKLADLDTPTVNWMAEFYKAKLESLTWKYEHRDTNTLKLN